MDIDKITEAHEKLGYERGWRDGYAEAITGTELKKRGKWIIQYADKGLHGTKCSCCGFVWSEEIVAVKLAPVFSRIFTPYCPNCGARMDDGENEINR